jgi:hypothetical protein
MSATRSVNPVLLPAQKAALAQRYGAGEPLAALVREFRTWTLNAKWAIRTAGYPLRPEDAVPNRCRVCGAAVRSCTKRRLCAAHVRAFCSKCEAPLDAGRANRWCTACEGAHKQALWAKKGRCCTTCGAPATQHACQCEACLRETYALQRAAAEARARPCADCQQPMPAGRRSVRCTACYRRQERRGRKERQAQGKHRCGMCGEALPLSRASYCAGCDSMLQKWRHAYHQGNEIARRLGTVEPRRRWQEREAG